MEAGVRELDSKLRIERNSMMAKTTGEDFLLELRMRRELRREMRRAVIITWDDHEDSIGHDEHFHGAHSPTRRKNAPIGDEMDDDLGVEEGAEPHRRADVENDHGLHQPGKAQGRNQLVNGLALDDGKGRPGGNRQQRDEQRYRAEHVFGPARPQRHHRPGLVDELDVGDDDEKHRKDGAGNALAIRPGRNLRVVAGPDGVKVRKGRAEVQDQQDGADDADQQAQDVQQVGGAQGLGRRRGEGDDEQHHDGGAELRAVVEDDVDGFVVEGVDDGDGDEDGGEVGDEDGDVLGVWIKGHCWCLFSFFLLCCCWLCC